MGGAVSSGQDNDDLVDNLIGSDYIRTPEVERVFRAVDRADYFLPDARINAYKDLAWKKGNYHLSAPCIYSEVMERLCLEPGLSFLNLGSGTGYLSTMVGLILGSKGINHGIEMHADVIEYATKKLEDFKKYSGAIDEFEFCEPTFTKGNCLTLNGDVRQYDRVYCGAACPATYQNYMKNLLKINGILVMPFNDRLLQITRLSATDWDVTSALAVSFAMLIEPAENTNDVLYLDYIEPTPLQESCRVIVRSLLHKRIDIEHPELKEAKISKGPRKKRGLRRLVVPLFDSSEETSDDDDGHRDLGRVHLDHDENDANPRNVSNILDYVLEQIRESRNIAPDLSVPVPPEPPSPGPYNFSVDSDFIEPEPDEFEEWVEIRRNNQDRLYDVTPPSSSSNGNLVNNSEDNNSNNKMQVEANEVENIQENVQDVIVEEPEEEIDESENVELKEEATNNNSDDRKNTKREKFDSGLGEDIVFKNRTNSDNSDMEFEYSSNSNSSSTSSNDNNVEDRPPKRILHSRIRSGNKWRRVNLNNQRNDSDGDSSSSSSEEYSLPRELPTNTNDSVVTSSVYTTYMREKIQELPLPQVLKNYLNYYRDF